MKKLIEVEKLSYSIPYGDEILRDISFETEPGKIYGLLGINGAGKTTLTELLLGLRQPAKGSVKVLGENPLAEDRSELERISFLSQDLQIKEDLTVAQFLNFYADLRKGYSKKIEKEILGFLDIKKAPKISSLSTGQKVKAQITAALAALPDLLIVDEVTAVLDPQARSDFFTLLKDFRNRGTCVLLATNIAEDLVGAADQILFLKNKKLSRHSPEKLENLFKRKEAA